MKWGSFRFGVVSFAFLVACAAFGQSITATKAYVDGRVDALGKELARFAYFDGTPNDMRVSPIKGIGGFRFVDNSSEGDEFGMSYHSLGDSMWGFALWDMMEFPTSSRANPYFAIGLGGIRLPTGYADTEIGYIDWPVIWNGLNVSDQVFDSSNSNSRRSINSRAINNYIYYELPRVVGRYVATGNVHSATGVLKDAGEIATFESIIEDAAYFTATSKVVKSVSYGKWTSSMSLEKDGGILNHMEFKDGKWHVYIDDAWGLKNYLLFSIEGDEDATDLLYSGQYGTYTFSRAKTVEEENRFGLPTHETVTNVARAVSNSFWDEKNEVLWRMEFRDGEPMFVPVTNENVKATGGVL